MTIVVWDPTTERIESTVRWHVITLYLLLFCINAWWWIDSIWNIQPKPIRENKVVYRPMIYPLLVYGRTTVCPTHYQKWHFFNSNSKFEQEYVRCVRNEEECVCSAPNWCDTQQQSAASQPVIKEMPGSVASGTPYII